MEAVTKVGGTQPIVALGVIATRRVKSDGRPQVNSAERITFHSRPPPPQQHDDDELVFIGGIEARYKFGNQKKGISISQQTSSAASIAKGRR